MFRLVFLLLFASYAYSEVRVKAFCSALNDAIVLEATVASEHETLIYAVGSRSSLQSSSGEVSLLFAADLTGTGDESGLSELGFLPDSSSVKVDEEFVRTQFVKQDPQRMYYDEATLDELFEMRNHSVLRVINFGRIGAIDNTQFFVYEHDRTDKIKYRIASPLFHRFVELEELEVSKEFAKAFEAALNRFLGADTEGGNGSLRIENPKKRSYQRLAYYGTFRKDEIQSNARIESAILFKHFSKVDYQLLTFNRESNRYVSVGKVEPIDETPLRRSLTAREHLLAFGQDGYRPMNSLIAKGLQIDMVKTLLPQSAASDRVSSLIGSLLPREESKLTFAAEFFPEHAVGLDKGSLRQHNPSESVRVMSRLNQVFQADLVRNMETHDLVGPAILAELRLNGNAHSILTFFAD